MKSREIFLQQPILLELEAPLKICGKTSLSGVLIISFGSKLKEKISEASEKFFVYLHRKFVK